VVLWLDKLLSYKICFLHKNSVSLCGELLRVVTQQCWEVAATARADRNALAVVFLRYPYNFL
jgi:hypothetical protein